MNLEFVFQSDIECSRQILSFLNKKELARLSCVSSEIRQQCIEHIKLQYNDEYVSWRSQKIKRLMTQQKASKSPNAIKFIETDTNYIMKMRIFDIPLRYLDAKNWTHMNESDEQFVKSIKSDKFIKEYNNLFFKNNEHNDILFVNRSMLDSTLNFIDQSAFDEEEYEQNKYEDLFQGGTFSANNYDFSSMQSMLARQKQIISKIAKKEEQKQQLLADEASYLNSLPNIKKITIILCHGGFFSIGIYNNKGVCVFHKSDHKYVVRKKAGKRQLNCDTQTGKQVKSMGSQIRRDQEKKHQEKVHSILNDHIEEIENTDVVFLQAPGVNKLILLRENQPLMRVQHKLRSICLTAKKANYTEVERIYKALTKVYLVLNKHS